MHVGVSKPETIAGRRDVVCPPTRTAKRIQAQEGLQQECTLQPGAAARQPAGSSWTKLQNAQKRATRPPLARQMLKQSPPLCVTKASRWAAEPVGLLQTSACRKAVSWAVLRPHGQCRGSPAAPSLTARSTAQPQHPPLPSSLRDITLIPSRQTDRAQHNVNTERGERKALLSSLAHSSSSLSAQTPVLPLHMKTPGKTPWS